MKRTDGRQAHRYTPRTFRSRYEKFFYIAANTGNVYRPLYDLGRYWPPVEVAGKMSKKLKRCLQESE